MWDSAASRSISTHGLPPWASSLPLHNPPCFFFLTHLPVPPCLLLALTCFPFGGAGCHRLFQCTKLANRPLPAPPCMSWLKGRRKCLQELADFRRLISGKSVIGHMSRNRLQRQHFKNPTPLPKTSPLFKIVKYLLICLLADAWVSL